MTQLIKQLKNKVAEGLITQNPRTPRFYTKPKIHKEGIPGGPVIFVQLIATVQKYWNMLITTYNQ